MSAEYKTLSCEEVATLLVFYASKEVNEREGGQIDAHLAVCGICAAHFEEERAFSETITALPQLADEIDSAGVVLSQCRSQLAEALDDLSLPPVSARWQPFGWLRRWMVIHPAWSGALLLLFGILFGTQVMPWLQSGPGSNFGGQAVNVMAAPKVTDDQLANMVVAGINLTSSPDSLPGTVQLQLSTDQPLVLSGNVDDADVRRVLTYVLENGERFDAGVRLDSLEALKPWAQDLGVQHSLLAAARRDRNAAVRMKALESLHDVRGDAVRETLLDVLDHDGNTGVRIEAVNMLVRSLQSDDGDTLGSGDLSGLSEAAEFTPSLHDSSVDRALQTLQNLEHRDPSRYVRLRSAAALRQIAARALP